MRKHPIIRNAQDILSYTIKKENGCMEWKGTYQGLYGCAVYEGKSWRVNRLIMFLLGHEIEGLESCHRCDNPACVNPEHLVMAPHSENMKDDSVKGSSPLIPLLKGFVFQKPTIEDRGKKLSLDEVAQKLTGIKTMTWDLYVSESKSLIIGGIKYKPE